MQIFGGNSIGMGIRVDLDTDPDVLVALGATVGSTNYIAIYGTGSGHVANIQGTVGGAAGGVSLGNDVALDSKQKLVIGVNGYVSTVGNAYAVDIQGYDSTVDNHGTIWSEGTAIYIGGQAAGNTHSHIANDGTIEGAIVHDTMSTETLVIDNAGLIAADGLVFFSASSARTFLTNTGTMKGAIQFGGGADLFDGRAGAMLGTVNGGGGKDTLLGGSGADAFYGGIGDDVLSGGGGNDRLDGQGGNDQMIGGKGSDVYLVDSAGDTVNEAVAGSTGVDRVESDVTFGLTDAVHAKGAIENLTLTSGGAINGTGNGLANALVGGGGNNILRGLGGRDTITGGLGLDTMTGGAGNDRFVFQSAVESTVAAPDRIRDFDDKGNDKIDLSAVFAGTLTWKGAGALTGLNQVRLRDIAGPDVLVEINLSGDAAPDMVIRLAGTTAASMTASDFVL